MLRRKKPTYLKRTAAQRRDYLARQSDDQVRVLSLDLETRGTPCRLVREELQRRGLDALNPDDHDLPHEAFGDDEAIRSLPSVVAYAWKWMCFHAVKNLLPLTLALVAVAVIAPKAEVILSWLTLAVAVCTLPIFFGWFNFGFTPLRYTLVRPFNARQYSKPMQRFIVQNIGLRCQGVGLACKQIKTSWVLVFIEKFQYAAMFIHYGAAFSVAVFCGLFYPWFKPSLQFSRKIRNPTDFKHINELFQHNRPMMFKHFFTGGQCLNIQSEDDSWRYAIQTLIHHSDFILVDLSSVKPSSEWEIEYLVRSDRIIDCIPVCQEGFEEAASSFSDLFAWPILVYNRRGKVLNGESSVAALIRKITEPQPGAAPPPRSAGAIEAAPSQDELGPLVRPEE